MTRSDPFGACTLPAGEPNAATLRRVLIDWIEQGTGVRVDYDFREKYSGLTLAFTAGAFRQKGYILGGYHAKIQFALVCRTYPEDREKRLTADEQLTMLADWMTQNRPVFPAPFRFRKIAQESPAQMTKRYENGMEDHSVTMTLFFEVIEPYG